MHNGGKAATDKLTQPITPESSDFKADINKYVKIPKKQRSPSKHQ
jgi:hypothetical protein